MFLDVYIFIYLSESAGQTCVRIFDLLIKYKKKKTLRYLSIT